MSKHTYAEIANDWNLWAEYVDPAGVDSEEEFDAKTEAEKIAFMESCFGKEKKTYSVKYTDGRTEEIDADTIDIAYLEALKGIPETFIERGLGFKVEGPDGEMECSGGELEEATA